MYFMKLSSQTRKLGHATNHDDTGFHKTTQCHTAVWTARYIGWYITVPNYGNIALEIKENSQADTLKAISVSKA